MRIGLFLNLILLLSHSQGHSGKHEIFKLRQKHFEKLAEVSAKISHTVFPNDVITASLFLIKSSEAFFVEDFLEDFLARLFKVTKLTIHQEHSENVTTILGNRKRFVIILMKSFGDFLKIYNSFSLKAFKYNGFYLIILLKSEFSEIQNIFTLLWKLQIYNVNVVYEKQDDVVVETFMPHNDKSCNDTKPVIVNRFINGKFERSLENVFVDKMKNLHNCPVRVSISNDVEPFVFAKYFSNGTYQLEGQDVDLIETLAESLNFKVDFTYVGEVGYFLANGSGRGPLKILFDNKADLSLSYFVMKITRLMLFDSTTPYTSESMNFIVPPGGDLTSFEKLVFPFSLYLWISILACFIIGILVIFIIMRCSINVQNFVFGAEVKNHCFNMFVNFIGGSQNVLPRRNFGRFLLMTFLVYSLIIRTLYQASYYQFVKSNKGHKEVQTIDEMIEKDFRFYVEQGIADVFQGTEAMKKRFVA